MEDWTWLSEFRHDFLRAMIILLAQRKTNADELMALLLHVEEDWSFRDIADMLDCSPATVSRMIDRLCNTIVDSGLLAGYDE